MIDARCLSCPYQKPLAEFVAEGGKVNGEIRKMLIAGAVEQWRYGICWRCEREKRAQQMTEHRQ